MVRLHLQVGTYMKSPDQVKKAELQRLRRILNLAEDVGLYLDLTGLGCYHLNAIPAWYDELPEAERWEVQAKFWEAVARTCRRSSGRLLLRPDERARGWRSQGRRSSLAAGRTGRFLLRPEGQQSSRKVARTTRLRPRGLRGLLRRSASTTAIIW